MNTELLNSKNQNEQSLDERFATRPRLRQRLLGMADLIDQAVTEGWTAHEAETRAVEQIRKLGQEVLTDWAEKAEHAARRQAQEEDSKLIQYGNKKLLTWHSTYGDISVTEQCLRLGRRGPQVRPFCQRAAIGPRSYSLPLQRALVDFGADESFLDATKKVREHYGVEVPVSAAREHTLTHAKAVGALEHQPAPPAKVVITGMDGSMIPLVESGAGEDRRKGKTLSWEQAHLCCARAQDTVECVYGATLASVKMAGLMWRTVVVGAGHVPTSSIHAVADGADAIFHAFHEQFDTSEGKAKFTVDFYHVDEHLGQAADCLAPTQKKAWLHEQHGRLLENRVGEVLQTLAAGFEPLGQEPAPVRGVHQYIAKRKDQMDYAGARAADLPIGSGEVESGHRHVIQQRLKIAGAWWTLPNAEVMLQLRTTRANRDWDRYWLELAKN